MKISIILAFLVLFITCCSTVVDKNQIGMSYTIDLILNNPDSLIKTIDQSPYYNKETRNNLLCDDTLNFYIPYIKSVVKDGYDYVNVDFWTYSPGDYIIQLCEEVQIKGRKNDMYINFLFRTRNDRRYLAEIRKGEKTKREILIETAVVPH